MADWKNLGNSAPNVLFVASLSVWAALLVRKCRGKPILEPWSQEPVPWPALPMCATFLVAFFMPVFIVALAAPGERVSIAAIRWSCAGLAGQALTVVGLLAFAGPLRKRDFGCDLTTWRQDLMIGVAGFLASLAPVFIALEMLARWDLRGPDDKHALLKAIDANSEP